MAQDLDKAVPHIARQDVDITEDLALIQHYGRKMSHDHYLFSLLLNIVELSKWGLWLHRNGFEGCLALCIGASWNSE